MTGLTGRVSRILVEPAPGMEARVRAALVRLAAGRLNVESTSYDERLFATAASASNQSTALFAVISALVGFLFAFNAMLLTVPQRRRLIADLRRDGYPPATVVALLLLDAVALGLVACVLGLGWGMSLDPPVPLESRLPGFGVRRRHAAGRRLAEHRDRRRRRHVCGCRRCVEPAAGHHLARSTHRDHPQARLRRRSGRHPSGARGRAVPGGG